MSRIIGIDLGTTSARVAMMDQGAPVILENSEGEGTTPCYVAITEDGSRLVGEAARRYALRNPADVAYAVKRFLGRRFDDPAIANIQRFMPYEICRAPNGDAWVRLKGQLYSPVQISAFILQKMKKTAENYLGEVVRSALISVPAYFNDAQRQATRDAGKIAGLDVLRIVNEPTSAALAYGLGDTKQDQVAVYDLGGGTFDVSLLEIGDGIFEVRSTRGDMLLGGEDFDYILTSHLADEFFVMHGIDLLKDPIARLRLKQAAENAKFELTHSNSAFIDLPFVSTQNGSPLHLHQAVARSKFEQMIMPLVDRSIEVCEAAIKDANGFRATKVVLVGGSTRIPLVARKLEKFFKIKPFGGLRREDAVALGAAIYAGVLEGDVKSTVLLDVNSMSIGVETLGGVFTPLIERNTSIPTKKSQIFSTSEDNQRAVTIRVFQGEKEMAEDNRALGQFDLIGIPPAPRGFPQIEVTLDIDADGIVTVNATDKATNAQQSMRVNPSGGLSAAEIEAMQSDAAELGLVNPLLSPALEFALTPEPIARTVPDEAPDASKRSALNPPEHTARIFVSYAHEDAAWAQQVVKALSLSRRTGRVEVWVDRMLQTGDAWKTEIFDAISRSNVAVLLLSNDFFNSDFILDTELPMIFAEKERRRLTLIPIMVRPCPFELHAELSQFQLFNKPEEPLASLELWKAEAELSRLAREIARPFQ